MKSAFECFHHAAKCEQMANDVADQTDRAMLLETARHWRTLGEQAKRKGGADDVRRTDDPPESSN